MEALQEEIIKPVDPALTVKANASIVPFDPKKLAFLEEIFYEEYENPITASILKGCGPLTLLIFNRCINLSHKYPDFKDFRILLGVGNKCITEDNPELYMEHTSKILSDIFKLISFTFHMSKRDGLYQWKFQNMLRHIFPSTSEV